MDTTDEIKGLSLEIEAKRKERDRAIITMVAGGSSLADAGRLFGVTGERVRQIVAREKAGGGDER